MMFLYAIDPSALSNNDRVKFLTSSIGAGTGRWVADLPNRKWVKELIVAIGDDQNALKKIEIYLDKLRPYLVRIEPPAYDPDRTWLEQTVQAYGDDGCEILRAIVAEQSDPSTNKAVAWDDLDDGSERWRVPRLVPGFPRKTSTILSSLELLLRQSRTIDVIDLYLNLDPERGSSICDGIIDLANRGKKPARIAFHTGPNSGTWENCLKCLREKVSKPNPCCEIELYRWDNNPKIKDDYPHDRAVLTDLGGIQFGAGLDPKNGRSMTATLVDKTDADQWVNLLDPDQSPFALLAKESV